MASDGWQKLHCEHGKSVIMTRNASTDSEWARTFPGIRASNQSAAKAYCVAGNTHFGIGHGGRHDVKRHIERAAQISKAQSRLGSINRFVAGCEIDKGTSAEIAFAIFIAMHNLPMAVGDEFGLLAKKMWYHSTSCAPWWWKNTNYRFSRFFVRAVPLFRSLMLTPMKMGCLEYT